MPELAILATSIFKSKWFWIILAVVVIIYLIYKYGKNSASIPVVSYNKTGLPSDFNPQPIASELHDDLDGLFTLGSTKNNILQKLNDMPDSQLVAVANVFNSLYFKAGKGTIANWISDEILVSRPLRDSVVARLETLGFTKQ